MSIYKKIRQLFSFGYDPDAFLAKENDWEYLYNLSPVRTNILKWFDFKEGRRVLELGAGTGIITEYLISKGLNVTPVETDEEKKDLLKLRLRTEGYDKIPIRDITIDEPVYRSYDYVTMIDCFSVENLNTAVKFLKPTGKLFVAMENKYAEPVWSRRPKDELPGLDEIRKMLSDRGLIISSLYFPSPDHIFPMEISVDPNEVASASYLLVCELETSEESKDDRLVYAKFNSFRKPEFQTATYIKESKTGRYVVKCPMTDEARELISQFQKTYEILDGSKPGRTNAAKYYKSISILKGKSKDNCVIFPYIVDGKNIDYGVDISKDTLDEIKSKLTHALDQMFDINDEFISTFEPTAEFAAVFGAKNITGLKTVASKSGKKIKALKASNYDSIFDNFLVKEDGVYALDYEWFFNFPIPLSFLKFRALSIFFGKNENALSKRISREEFFKLFGFAGVQVAIFDNMEECFQEYVFGKNKKRLYIERYRASNEGHEKRSGRDRFNKSFHKLHMVGKSKIYGAMNRKAALSDDYKNYQERRYREIEAEVEGDYNTWIRKCDSEYKVPSTYRYNPLISIVIYGMDDHWANADRTIESIKENRYTNYEITSIDSVAGEYVLFIKKGDTLSSFALSEIVAVINEDRDVPFIYSDEDVQNENGIREAGFMKPDWALDTFLSSGYTGTMGVFKTSVIKDYMDKYLSGGSISDELSKYALYRLILSIAKNGRIRHMPRVLYHTSSFEVHTDKAALERYLDKNRIKASVEDAGDGRLRILYDTKKEDTISIIIPSKDNPAVLEKCVRSVVMEPHKNVMKYEVIIVDNGSTPENKRAVQEMIRKVSSETGILGEPKSEMRLGLQRIEYIYDSYDFNFSKMCNIGAENAEGRYLLFLNDDVTASGGTWLGRMLGQAAQPYNGAIGAKLLYPETSLIQHDGIICRRRDPVHLFSKMDDSQELYFGYNRFDRNVLAVTGACLMVGKDKFNRIGGFDKELPIAYNDVDLCFRLHQAGYENVLRNDAVLYHHESLSRGPDIDDKKFNRLLSEKKKLYDKNPELEILDPYYNPYLTRIKTDADYAFERFNIYEVRSLQEDEVVRRGTTVLCEVDLARLDGDITIEGWAFEPGSLYNPDMKVDVLLEKLTIAEDDEAENEKAAEKNREEDAPASRSYVVSTTKKRRPDVAEKYSSETSIDFAGFITRFDKDLIEEGTYSVSIFYEGKKYPTPEKITV
ncbi:MAG: glycosyltransferase [Eubacterium sp.]|nr:glycosyltransferase [Eubacterium sp.]